MSQWHNLFVQCLPLLSVQLIVSAMVGMCQQVYVGATNENLLRDGAGNWHVDESAGFPLYALSCHIKSAVDGKYIASGQSNHQHVSYAVVSTCCGRQTVMGRNVLQRLKGLEKALADVWQHFGLLCISIHSILSESTVSYAL